VKFGARDLNVITLNECDFLENRRIKGRTFFTTVKLQRICIGKTVRRFENEDRRVKSGPYVTYCSISSGVKSERPWKWRYDKHARTHAHL